MFVQIGDENVHRVRALMDEVFGAESFQALIAFTKGATGLAASGRMPARLDYLLWYGRSAGTPTKYRQLYSLKSTEDDRNFPWAILPSGERGRRSKFGTQLPDGTRSGQDVSLSKPGPGAKYEVEYVGRCFDSGKRWWGTTKNQLERALKTDRIVVVGNSLRHLRYLDESSLTAIGNLWDGFLGQTAPVYVVQTNTDIVERCLLMTTDPGDLVLDPTCGSGTTAYVAEQWGRRWITFDTSRVALALARARVMGARYPYYLLADSREGQEREAEITRSVPKQTATYGRLRQGFVYERVPHITLRAIANNAEIDVIWERLQPAVEAALCELNEALIGHPGLLEVATGGRKGLTVDFCAPAGETVPLPSGKEAPANGLLEWEVPREAPEDWPPEAREALAAFWLVRIARESEMDASIAARAEFEYLYDKPYEDKTKVRVAGPFTVESLSPHRSLLIDDEDNLVDTIGEARKTNGTGQDFGGMILDQLRRAGVQQTHREDRIEFTSLRLWPGKMIAGEGSYLEAGSGEDRRAGILVGPEFGTVTRPDLVDAAREAADAGFDVLISCAFSYDAQASEFTKLGRVPVLKARMNADLHMAEDLKNTGKGNLFVIFGEPDIDVLPVPTENGGEEQFQVKLNGVDVFDPRTGKVRSDSADGIACWFIDTDYNGESFFVRHAYFLGANDPYKSLKTSLKAEIDREAWETLRSDTSRPFPPPGSGRIAVKVINHLGDEVMKVLRVVGRRP